MNKNDDEKLKTNNASSSSSEMEDFKSRIKKIGNDGQKIISTISEVTTKNNNKNLGAPQPLTIITSNLQKVELDTPPSQTSIINSKSPKTPKSPKSPLSAFLRILTKKKRKQPILIEQVYYGKEPGTPSSTTSSLTTPVLLPPRRLDRSFTVVLDLDETLLHAVVYNMRDSFDEVYVEGSDFQFSLGKFEYIITLRPNLKQFLQWASEKFELILYTAGSEDYAKQVLKRIDPEDVYFSHKFTRKNCIKNKS